MFSLLDNFIFLLCLTLSVTGFIVNGRKHRGFALFNIIAVLLLLAFKVCIDFYDIIVYLLKNTLPAEAFETLRIIIKSVFIFGAGIYIGLDIAIRIICFVVLLVTAVRAVVILIRNAAAARDTAVTDRNVIAGDCFDLNKRQLYLELDRLRN